MFRIKCMENRTFVDYLRDFDENIIEKETSDLAKHHADALNRVAKRDGSNCRYVIQKMTGDPNWREREQQRCSDGTYTIPYFAMSTAYYGSEYNGLHYLHISQDDPMRVAYTPNDEYGRHDRQVRVRLERYLDRFFPDLPTVLRNEEIAEHKKRNEYRPLHFAQTADEIEWVYLNGPRSCMAKPVEDFDWDFHPVRLYATNDLAVAYTKAPDGGVSARTLVRPYRKAHARIYGNNPQLEKRLEEAGYYRDDNLFEGARLHLEYHDDDKIVAPYCDPVRHARIDEDCLTLDYEGDICLNTEDGVVQLPVTCDSCHTPVLPSATRPIEANGTTEDWCEDCIVDHAFRCNVCHEHVPEAQRNETAEGRNVCDRCADSLPTCAECNVPTTCEWPDPRSEDQRLCSLCEDSVHAELENAETEITHA